MDMKMDIKVLIIIIIIIVININKQVVTLEFIRACADGLLANVYLVLAMLLCTTEFIPVFTSLT